MQVKNNLFLLSVIFSTYIFGQCADPIPGTSVWTLAADALGKMCTIQSKVCDLESAIDGDFAGTFTVYDLILEKACNNLTTSEEIDSSFDELEMDLPPTISKLCVIESKVLALEDDVQNINVSANDGIYSALDGLQTILCSKVEQVASEVTQVQNTIINITQSEIDNTQTILSKLDILDDQVDELNSALDVFPTNQLNSCTDVLVSLGDNLLVDVCDLESAVEVGFDGTFTALDAQLVKACDLVSLTDVMDPTVMVDFTGVFTLLDALQETVCTIESLVDIVCLINTEQLLCTAGSKIDLALAKMCTTESVIDPLISIADEVISTLEHVDEQAIVDVCSNIEEAISLADVIEIKVDDINASVDTWQVVESFSKLENIEQTLLTVCSKLDAIDVTDSKLCIVDSKVGVLNQDALTVESVIDEINSQADTVDSKIDTFALLSQVDFIASKVCNILDGTQTINSNVDALDTTLETIDTKLDYIIENMPFKGSFFAYVCNADDDTVTPIDLATNTPLATIAVGNDPDAIAITPDGAFAYVCNVLDDTVTPIDLATNTPLATIAVGNLPSAIAITPDGAFAYVCNRSDDTVTPIDLATNTPLASIAVGSQPWGIAITPDGAFAYVCNVTDNNVTPIDLATNTPLATIAVGNLPFAIAITPDGAFAYVCNRNSNNVQPIDLATNTPLATIAVGFAPRAIAITPDGAFAYVCNAFDDTVTPIDLATNTPLATIALGDVPFAIAITPDGASAYVCNRSDNNVTPIDLATNTPLATIAVGNSPSAIAITPDSTIRAKAVILKNKICAIDVNQLNSKLDNIESLVCTIESNMDVANSLVDNANNKAMDLEDDFASTWTTLGTIEQKLCTSESVLETVSSKLDNLDVSVDLSGIYTTIDTILLKECTVDSKTDVALSLADIFIANQGDLSGTFTALDALLLKVCTIESQTDVLDGNVDSLVAYCGVPIRNGDLPLTISTPGRYFVAESLVYTPTGTDTNAITISVNNVFLDLNNMTIEQGDSTTSTRAILVLDDVNNVSIVNGRIANFVGHAVGLISNTSNILIRNISTDNCGFPQSNAIDVQTVVDLLMDNVNLANGFFGTTIVNPTNVTLRNCSAMNNIGDGFAFQDGSNVFVQGCKAYNQSAQSNTGSGFVAQRTDVAENYVFENCIAEDNIVSGFQVNRNGTANSTNLVIRNCISNRNTQDGIRVTGNQHVIINNTCSGNTLQGIRVASASAANNYVAFNTCIENSTNFDELVSTSTNTYLGNFAFNSTAVGDPDNTNYTISGPSDIGSKFTTLAQTTVFDATTQKPTKWSNINMLP